MNEETTLRDKFAIAALTGLIASEADGVSYENEVECMQLQNELETLRAENEALKADAKTCRNLAESYIRANEKLQRKQQGFKDDIEAKDAQIRALVEGLTEAIRINREMKTGILSTAPEFTLTVLEGYILTWESALSQLTALEAKKCEIIDRTYDQVIVGCELPDKDVKFTYFPRNNTSVREVVSLMDEEREYISKIRCSDNIPDDIIRTLKVKALEAHKEGKR